MLHIVHVESRGNDFAKRKEFEWTKITGGIRFWPQFMDDQESMLDELDHFTVLTE